jgi:hypothetical protein
MIADKIREEQERIQNELQNAQAEQARKIPNTADKASVRAHSVRRKDRVRASAKGHQDVIEQYQAKYVGGATSMPKPPKASKVASGWTLEGNYGTRKDANLVSRNLRAAGNFTMVRRMADGTYNVWKKDGASVKSYKLKTKGGKEISGGGYGVGQTVETTGRTVERLTSLGSLPEYKPPNFQLAKSGYKPLDYRPIDNKPMFQYTGFKTMDYKPISNEPYYKPSGVGNEPYYKPHQYQPIGQFGSVLNNPPNISGLQRSEEPVKKVRKKKRKSKEPRLIGE